MTYLINIMQVAKLSRSIEWLISFLSYYANGWATWISMIFIVLTTLNSIHYWSVFRFELRFQEKVEFTIVWMWFELFGKFYYTFSFSYFYVYCWINEVSHWCKLHSPLIMYQMYAVTREKIYFYMNIDF